MRAGDTVACRCAIIVGYAKDDGWVAGGFVHGKAKSRGAGRGCTGHLAREQGGRIGDIGKIRAPSVETPGPERIGRYAPKRCTIQQEGDGAIRMPHAVKHQRSVARACVE